jgi:geranylgeranyl diphosphate synthase, type II
VSTSTPYPEHLRARIEEFLREIDFLPADPAAREHAAGTEGLVEAMRYSLLAGGKRFRPVLCLATGEALGVDPGRLVPAAAALELIHTYSLIHDDLPAMDDDDLRRGKPTCHKAFGEDAAILAGDALFAEAVRLVCEQQAGGPAVQVGMLAEISRATGVGGMVGGQFLDLRDAGLLSADSLRRVHLLKTGRLIGACVTCALVLAPPAPTIAAHYRSFADELGLLFQIVDDILDEVGSEALLGKAVGADARRGKATYVSVHGLKRARELADERHRQALALLDAIPGPTDDLAALADHVYQRQS